jgi:hypothetical protein
MIDFLKKAEAVPVVLARLRGLLVTARTLAAQSDQFASNRQRARAAKFVSDAERWVSNAMHQFRFTVDDLLNVPEDQLAQKHLPVHMQYADAEPVYVRLMRDIAVATAYAELLEEEHNSFLTSLNEKDSD